MSGYDKLEGLKDLFRKTGFAPYLKRAVGPLARHKSMRFPTFSPSIHAEIAAESDYVRFATLALAAERISSERIDGSIAEVGVYRGDTSKLLNAMTGGRRYYLFDTFEGFPQEDLEAGMAGDDRFKDTSVKTVLRNIGNPRNVVVRKGYVPDTFSGLEGETFAFVLLDLDLYNPTLESLSFFYPRMASGGYVCVHDYNNPEANWACKRALDGFMEDKPERLIEVADMWGTALFRKL